MLGRSFIEDSPTRAERIHDGAKVVYSGHFVAEHQEEKPTRRASTGEQKLEDPFTP